MGRAKETFGKKQTRENQLKKRQEKERRKQERKEQGKSSFEDMIAWVDANGQIVSEPPTEEKEEIKASDIDVSIPKGGVKSVEIINEGKVRNYDDSKGFGFIQSNSYENSIFFHINDCLEEIKPGYKVSFDLEKGQKGMKAINVKKVS